MGAASLGADLRYETPVKAMRLFAVIAVVALLGCGPLIEPGPFEQAEDEGWELVNRRHRGSDGIYLQATFHTFAYEIAKAFARAEQDGLDQGQLESRLRELVYRHSVADYPVDDGTDINSLYFQYLIYVNESFDPGNRLQKRVYDNWVMQIVRQVVDNVFDPKYPILRNYYDERWGLTLYSRLVFYVYLDNTNSDLSPRVDDIGDRTFLIDDAGNRYRPSGLAGPYPYESNRPEESHLDGKLVYPVFFPNRRVDRATPILSAESKYVELVVKGLGGEAERRLRWDLPLEYPSLPGRRLLSPAEQEAMEQEEET